MERKSKSHNFYSEFQSHFRLSIKYWWESASLSSSYPFMLPLQVTHLAFMHKEQGRNYVNVVVTVTTLQWHGYICSDAAVMSGSFSTTSQVIWWSIGQVIDSYPPLQHPCLFMEEASPLVLSTPFTGSITNAIRIIEGSSTYFTRSP